MKYLCSEPLFPREYSLLKIGECYRYLSPWHSTFSIICDIRKITVETFEILSNKKVIDVNEGNLLCLCLKVWKFSPIYVKIAHYRLIYFWTDFKNAALKGHAFDITIAGFVNNINTWLYWNGTLGYINGGTLDFHSYMC